MNINKKLTETDIDNIDFKSQWEHQIQIQGKSGRIFDKIYPMKIRCYKIGELNGSSYVKTPLRLKMIIIVLFGQF